MKVVTHLSDLTGNEIEEHVQVSIKAMGKGVKLGKTTYFGDTVLDLDAKELPTFFKELEIAESHMPEMFKVTPENIKAAAVFGVPGGK